MTYIAFNSAVVIIDVILNIMIGIKIKSEGAKIALMLFCNLFMVAVIGMGFIVKILFGNGGE